MITREILINALHQVILGAPYRLLSDVWSYACVVAEIFTTHPLFAVPNAKELAEEKAGVQTLSRISHCLANGAEGKFLHGSGSKDVSRSPASAYI